MSKIRPLLVPVFLFCILGSLFMKEEAFAATGTSTETGWIITDSGDNDIFIKNTGETKAPTTEKEKTINDINNFLIESYKIKIDKILADLNVSIDRVTNNDPVAKTKLLGKIRTDITSKIESINSHKVSANRRKILSSIFTYIQQNIDAEIQKVAQQK